MNWQDWDRRESREARKWAVIAWVMLIGSVIVMVAGIVAIVGFILAILG